MTFDNTAVSQKASQTRKSKPRLLAAASLSHRYAVSLGHAKIIADLQGYRMVGAHD